MIEGARPIRGPSLAASALGALLGAAFFVSIAGWRLVVPTEYEWAMKFDWRIHFLGWHVFRGEPWHWPPGVVSGYYHAPDGTAIGYTDSLPIVAFLLKPFSALLPMPMQYLGLWLTFCFAAQGWWGVRLASLWTTSMAAQVLASTIFVLAPILLNRAVHPALCAQWLLLWGIFLYLSWRPGVRVPRGSMAALGAVAGLVHPYIALMVLALLAALTIRTVWASSAGTGMRRLEGVPALGAALALVVAGWWASGLFTVSGASMARPGLGVFSMNLLAPITHSGWSSILPDLPVATVGHAFEGFQYLGLGMLGLLAVAILLAWPLATADALRALAPLVVVCLLLAVFALSPRITLGDRVVADFSSPTLDRLAIFGVTGRFGWPAVYTAIALTLAVILIRVRPPIAAAVLTIAAIVQIVDLRPAFAERYALTHGPDFHRWPAAPRSPVWAAALPHYERIVLFYPAQCGGAPVTFELPVFLAGLHGLTANVGEVARMSEPDRVAYCRELERTMTAGEVDDRSFYLVQRDHEPRIRAAAPSLHCGTVDGIRACVTARSYEAWRHVAPLD